MENEEFKDDQLDEKIEIQPQIRRKPVVVTQKEMQMLKFSENSHIADLQQRVIRLEYEVLFIRDKLFEPSKTKNQEKLSPFGKLIKSRINNGNN